MPSGEHMLIWDSYNTNLVKHWWGKCTPEEIQAIVNYRQWKLERRNFAYLGGVLRRAVEFGIITEKEYSAYKKQHNRQRKEAESNGESLWPDMGTNPETKQPMAITLGKWVTWVEAETGTSAHGYRVIYPSEEASWHKMTPEELAQTDPVIPSLSDQGENTCQR